jgi:photosystem II stability/assembly factor-like uncharacterized protein
MIKKAHIRVCLSLLLIAMTSSVSAQWFREESGTTERLRAISVPSDSIAWASGNHGTVVRTTDAGKNWTTLRVPGADSLDFRDVEAFNAQDAFILSIGPGEDSRIYQTSDGGKAWTLQYIAEDPRIFLDEFAFWDSMNGIAVGDAVDGHLYSIRTSDGGLHWNRIPPSQIPVALPEEGAFAASGSGITVEGASNVWIGSGVNTARVFRSSDRGKNWNVSTTPILHESESAGIFSIAFWDSDRGIVVGGDYRKENDARNNVALTYDGGVTWKLCNNPPSAGFRSAVMFLTKEYLITVGPSGSDYSTDGGKTWIQIDTIGYHAIGRARNGKAIWAVGEKGRIGHFVDLIVR